MGSELAVWLFDRHVGTLSIALCLRANLACLHSGDSVVLFAAAAQLPFIA